MTKTILIAVSDGFGGYGDFLFALKLSEQIKKYYANALGKDDVPNIKLVTQPSGKQKIKKLKGDTEFGVEILTPDELQDKVDKKELEVASIIEGPVFRSGLIYQINHAIQGQTQPAPLVMMPEYAYSSASHQIMIDSQKQFRKECLDRIIYQETIYTGFDSKTKEKGIILSDGLIHPEEPSALSSKLDEKIKSVLIGNVDIETYQKTNDLYFQYSHDTYPTTPKTSTAERFLKMHRIYAKDSKKNQNVLMIGKTEATKRQALEKIKKQLIADGFTKISFYNAETNDEEYLHGWPGDEGRHYRVVYAAGMTHPSMIAAQALSGDLVGATGDQSFGEAVSGDKILVYECLSHKQELRDEYYRQLKKRDSVCAEVLELLKNAERDSDYKRMESLMTPEMKVRLKHLSKSFRESDTLAKCAAKAAMPAEILSQQIINGTIAPYSDDPTSMSPFERTLMVGNFDAVSYVVNNCTSNRDDRRQFCEILTQKNHEGISFLSTLRRAKPNTPETNRASYLVTRFNIDKYKAEKNSERETMFNAYKELISTFSTLGNHDEDALIGLMLLTTKNIANEYSFLSPRKGMLFGSRFYSNLEDTLAELGVHIKTIMPAEKQRYYSALARVMESNPNLIANEYILDSLSKEANITLPKIPPLLTPDKAEELLQFNDADNTDPTLFYTKSGLYKTHLVPLGQGGWGSVFAARHYAQSEQGIKISPPLAIKMMPARNHLAMNKEAHMFSKACPEGHVAQFNKNGFAYMAMPLFPGIPLDNYLMDHLELPQATRHNIATSLLEYLHPIHQNGVIHNDIKPKNVLYDPVAKKTYIVDFGCAEEIGTTIQFKDINSAKFAIEYMPPEYLQGGSISEKTDMFSLTLTLAEILGANKHELVKNRMERALTKINEPVKTSIRNAFNFTGSLDEALFTREVAQHWNNPEFNHFIQEYVNEKYDFSPYEKILGKDTIELLNAMQNKDPALRPTIGDALEILNPKEAEITLETSL